jgi:hypothetical protein
LLKTLSTLTQPWKWPKERYRSALALLAIIGLFVTFSKLAFQSYFTDDDFSNLALARFVPWISLFKSLFSLRLELLVRPAGILYYKILGSTAHFHFAAYVAVLQALHIATSLMLWLFLRRLGIRTAAAAVGFLFFALHMSTLPAYWKPMYVFDVLCGFFVIASLLFYQREHFFVSLLCAWLAFKSKEMELMLPLVLLLYEWRIRKRATLAWRPLVPFFVMSVCFGLQGLMLPKGPETWYTPHLTLGGVWSGLAYYGGKLLYVHLAGVPISVGLLFLRQRLVTFGVISFWTLLVPMLFFAGHQAGVYLYVPLLAFALVVAAVADTKPWWAVLFLVIWIPASYEQLRQERNPILALGHENRPYVTQALVSIATPPVPQAIIYDGTPSEFHPWGQEGLFSFALDKFGLPIYRMDAPEAMEVIRRPGSILLSWNVRRHRLRRESFPGEDHEIAYIDFAETNPIWQLKQGWTGLEGNCRWVTAQSVISLREPRGDLTFAMEVILAPGQGERLHQILRVSSQTQSIGEYQFTTSASRRLTWPVSSRVDSVNDFEIKLDPPFQPDAHSSPLGVMICACGFLPRQ